MIGYAYAAGVRRSLIRPNAGEIASYLSVTPDRLAQALEVIETEEHPQTLLLQNTEQGAPIAAVVFFSSVWSKSYAKIGTPGTMSSDTDLLNGIRASESGLTLTELLRAPQHC